MMRFNLLFAILVIMFFSCNKKHKYSNIPKLTFKNMSEDVFVAGVDKTIYIWFLFEDGDGNIGFDTPNLFMKDNRDTVWSPFTIPVIPEKFNPESGLKGVLQIKYNAAYLLLRQDSLHTEKDTLTFDIYMKDKAGNVSNTITTTPIYLVK